MIKLICPMCGDSRGLDAELETNYLNGALFWCFVCLEPRLKAAGIDTKIPPDEIDHAELGMKPLELDLR